MKIQHSSFCPSSYEARLLRQSLSQARFAWQKVRLLYRSTWHPQGIKVTPTLSPSVTCLRCRLPQDIDVQSYLLSTHLLPPRHILFYNQTSVTFAIGHT